MSDKRFPSPFELEGPEGVEGWEELYPYSVVFSEDLECTWNVQEPVRKHYNFG